MPVFLLQKTDLSRRIITNIKSKHLLTPLILLIMLCISNCSGPQDYAQSYVITINGKVTGKEVVTEKTDIKGNRIYLSEQERDINAGPDNIKKRIIKTKTVFPKGEIFPSLYSYDSNSGTSFEIKLEGGKIIHTVNKDGTPQETVTTYEQGMLILDLGTFHTINFWISGCNSDIKKEQTFKTYTLPSSTVRTVSVIPGNELIPEKESKKMRLKNYEITVRKNLTIRLWVDENNRLYRMFVKGPNIDILRSDLFDRLNAGIKKVSMNE